MSEIERAIDEAMWKATTLFHKLTDQEDPYAMHKAVESLPTAVLVYVLAGKTTRDLRHEMEGQRSTQGKTE